MNLMDKEYCLFCVIVDFGKGSKILQACKELGATGGTIMLGKGTARSSLLVLLGLDEIRKEILLMGIEDNMDEYIHNKIAEKFALNKPNHGIAFSIPLKNCFGVKKFKNISGVKKKGADRMNYEAIFVIVDKGLAEDVIEAAEAGGSTGGTIIHGRGSGTQETSKLFNIEIEPEKDIVLILSQIQKTEPIVDSIKEKLNIDKPGKGIIFVLDVNRTTGLYNG